VSTTLAIAWAPERGEGERAGYRIGKVKTAKGAVDYSAPQVRDTLEPFISRVRSARTPSSFSIRPDGVLLDA